MSETKHENEIGTIEQLDQIQLIHKIDEIIFYTNPEGKVYPEDDLEINQKILNGFNWRIDEKILNKKNFLSK